MGGCHGPQMDLSVPPGAYSGCHGPQMPLSPEKTCSGCCASGNGPDLLAGACSSALQCKSRPDIELDTSSPIRGRIHDTHGEVLPGLAFGSCTASHSRLRKQSQAYASAAPNGPFAISQWPEAGGAGDNNLQQSPLLLDIDSGIARGIVAAASAPRTDSTTDTPVDGCVGIKCESLHGAGKLEGMQIGSEEWHGAGVLNWPDGRKYVGQFYHGVFEGDATMVWPDGRSFVGQYHENKKHGQGEFAWPDGRKYTGTWKNGQRDGHGMYTNARGEMRGGVWSEDRPISWDDDEFSKEPEKDGFPHVPCSQSKVKEDSAALRRSILGGA